MKSIYTSLDVMYGSQYAWMEDETEYFTWGPVGRDFARIMVYALNTILMEKPADRNCALSKF